MSVSTFDNELTKNERRIARRKHIAVLEVERSVSNDQARVARLESARRFLREEHYRDEEIVSTDASLVAGDTADEPVSPIEPQWDTFVSPSADGEGSVLDMRMRSRRRSTPGGSSFSCIGDCCLRMYHALVAAGDCITEQVTGFCHCSKRSFCILGAIIVIVITAVSISAIVKRPKSAAGVAPLAEFNDPIVADRYKFIRDVILASGVSDAKDLDAEGTAQNWAVRWLTEDDPAKLEPDDSFILQRYALATFFFSTHSEYNSTTNIEWYIGNDWMTGKGICLWKGVLCVPKGGAFQYRYDGNNHVVHLNLADNDIHGTLPSEIAALKKLDSINIRQNRFEGTIPTSIARIGSLTAIYLDDNAFTGTLATEFGKLKLLRKLYLSMNSLHGSIPDKIKGLEELEILYLSDNEFTGTVPDMFAKLSELEKLELHRNRLTGTLPESLGSLEKLTLLAVHNNSLTGSMPEEVCALTHLPKISADCNTGQGGTLSCDCCNECHP